MKIMNKFFTNREKIELSLLNLTSLAFCVNMILCEDIRMLVLALPLCYYMRRATRLDIFLTAVSREDFEERVKTLQSKLNKGVDQKL